MCIVTHGLVYNSVSGYVTSSRSTHKILPIELLRKSDMNAVDSVRFCSVDSERVRRSLDVESVKTLVRGFVTSRVDYCNSVLSSAPKKVTDKLQPI